MPSAAKTVDAEATECGVDEFECEDEERGCLECTMICQPQNFEPKLKLQYLLSFECWEIKFKCKQSKILSQKQRMWSISRASDLLPESTEGDAAANILLICPQDPNSILKTIFSAVTRYPSKAIHFYVVQEQVDVLARHFILLRTFFDESLPIRQRATTYLHLFGNAAITEADVNYVAEKASDLMDLVLDDKQLTCMEDVFDLSFLKQRDYYF